MRHLRSGWLVGVALAFCVPGARSAEAPVEWKGFIACGIIPGLTHLNLHEPIVVMVAGNTAHFERNVRRADTAQDSGYVERAGGEVQADGQVTLAGGATVGRKLSYSASYTGRLPPNGGVTSLIGTQTWVGPQIGRFDRPCHLDVSR